MEQTTQQIQQMPAPMTDERWYELDKHFSPAASADEKCAVIVELLTEVARQENEIQEGAAYCEQLSRDNQRLIGETHRWSAAVKKLEQERVAAWTNTADAMPVGFGRVLVVVKCRGMNQELFYHVEIAEHIQDPHTFNTWRTDGGEWLGNIQVVKWRHLPAAVEGEAGEREAPEGGGEA